MGHLVTEVLRSETDLDVTVRRRRSMIFTTNKALKA
jgi:hypothetical protein